jgi:hypothetical protein
VAGEPGAGDSDTPHAIHAPKPTGAPVAPNAPAAAGDGSATAVPPKDSPARPSVFAHTKDALYRFDALAGNVTLVGRFSCVPIGDGTFATSADDAVLDLAVDKTGQMYATTVWRLIKVNAATADCAIVRTELAPRRYPNSLSFVPAGTVDNGGEALVGYRPDGLGRATVYTWIDQHTGTMEDRASLNPPNASASFAVSGDLVPLSRGGTLTTYATVKALDANAPTSDFLAEIDPETGVLRRIVADTKQWDLFGLAAGANTLYGFSSSGFAFELDLAAGGAKLVLAAEDAARAPLAWWGATSVAP